MSTGIITKFYIFICFIFYLNTVESKLIELDEDNWHEMLDGEWMVEL